MDRYQRRVLRLRKHVLNKKTKEIIADSNGETQYLQGGNKDINNIIAYDDITKPDIIVMLTEKGIEHNPGDKKEDLYDLLLGSD